MSLANEIERGKGKGEGDSISNWPRLARKKIPKPVDVKREDSTQIARYNPSIHVMYNQDNCSGPSLVTKEKMIVVEWVGSWGIFMSEGKRAIQPITDRKLWSKTRHEPYILTNIVQENYLIDFCNFLHILYRSSKSRSKFLPFIKWEYERLFIWSMLLVQSFCYGHLSMDSSSLIIVSGVGFM